jgi:outer membrane protein assembly factor BamB
VFVPAAGGCATTLVTAQHKAGVLFVFFAGNMSLSATYQLSSFGECEIGGGEGCSGEFMTSAVYDGSLATLYVTSTSTPLRANPRFLNATDFPSVTIGLQAFSVDAACKLVTRWSNAYDLEVPPYESPFTTPTVANGVVYFGTGAFGSTIAADAATGRLLWKSPAAGPVFAPPLVADGAVYEAGYFGGVRKYAL